jgi:hypothetical protein
VDDNSVVLTKLSQSQKYDQGTITFRAKKGKLIDLDKLHESIWATRLSGSTSSGLVSLEVTAVGEIVASERAIVLKVAGADAYFELGENPDGEGRATFGQLKAALDRADRVVSVTGRLDGWAGRWPEVLRKLPPKPRRILVTGYDVAKGS